MTILAEIYGDPILFRSGPGFVNLTQSNPSFVNPVRSGPDFVNPIRSGLGFVNIPFSLCYVSFRVLTTGRCKKANEGLVIPRLNAPAEG